MVRSIAAVVLSLGIASEALGEVPAFQSAVAASAPVLYYQFNETGTNVVNYGSLGASFDGTYFGTPVRSFPTDGGDTGVYFDTSDDYIESLSSAPAAFTGNPTFTVEIVVGIPSGAVAQLWPPFLHWGTGNPQTGRSAWLGLQNNNNNVIFAGFYNSGLRTKSRIMLGNGHHIVWVRDGASNNSQQGTTLYIDGIAVQLEPDTDLQGPLVPNVASTNFLINRGHDLTRYFQGGMDELALYDRALTQNEILAHYMAAATATTVEGPVLPTSLQLSARPNPFQGATEVRCRAAETGPVLLTVHDTAGRRVTTLDGRYREAEDFIARWDGRDDAGRAVAPGVYFFRLQAGDRRTSQEVVLLR